MQDTNRSPWTCVLAVAVILVALPLAFFGLILYSFFHTDTIYAPGYSEEAFQSIEIGWTMKQVLEVAGEPLDKGPAGEGYELVYNDAQGVDPVIWVRFDANDTASNVYGTNLSPKHKNLVGKSEAEVLDILGEPDLREGPYSEGWQYTKQGPENTDFYIRGLLFDPDGKVSKIQSWTFYD